MPPLVAHPSEALASPGTAIGPVPVRVPHRGTVIVWAIIGQITNLPNQPGPWCEDPFPVVLDTFTLS